MHVNVVVCMLTALQDTFLLAKCCDLIKNPNLNRLLCHVTKFSLTEGGLEVCNVSKDLGECRVQKRGEAGTLTLPRPGVKSWPPQDFSTVLRGVSQLDTDPLLQF